MVSTVNKSKTEESSKDLWGTGLSLRSDTNAQLRSHIEIIKKVMAHEMVS